MLLNNDVIVTEGWLENLLDAHRRDPLVGVSAPRSNRIVGHQQIDHVTYPTLEAMHVLPKNARKIIPAFTTVRIGRLGSACAFRAT